MKEVADGVWHIDTITLPNAVNAYLIGDVLVDAGGRRSGSKILRQLKGHSVTSHARTHAHPDHQGASHEICEKLGIPFLVAANDVEVAENPTLIRDRQPDHPVAAFYYRFFTGPAHKVDQVLNEGDEVAGFQVLDTPGHSAGHVVFWRESDRVLVAGDVINNMNIWTGIPGLHEPKPYLTPDPEENRRSIKKVATLEPEIVLFGHGPPLRDPRKLQQFAASL
jgi:glyoxylase-like metal-dependent hydrolase (beta-lactamase superfamily II)